MAGSAGERDSGTMVSHVRRVGVCFLVVSETTGRLSISQSVKKRGGGGGVSVSSRSVREGKLCVCVGVCLVLYWWPGRQVSETVGRQAGCQSVYQSVMTDCQSVSQSGGWGGG